MEYNKPPPKKCIKILIDLCENMGLDTAEAFFALSSASRCLCPDRDFFIENCNITADIFDESIEDEQ